MWKKFLENLQKIKSKNQLENFLNSLLTNYEKKALIKRLAAISLIKQGKTYKEIEEILWISPSTINVIKKSIRVGSGFQSRYELEKNRRKQKDVKDRQYKRNVYTKSALDNLIDFFIMPPKIGRGRWKFYYQSR